MNDVDAVKSRLQELIDNRQEIANSLQQLNTQRIELESKFQQHNGAIAAFQELIPTEAEDSAPSEESD